MNGRAVVDGSLGERYGIVRLLNRVEEEAIDLEGLDQIGAQLRQSGGRALSLLVRRLWRERTGAVISRYTYLLKFFDDGAWIDQLIQIAQRRRDLEKDGKTALLTLLAGCGVDIGTPPLVGLLPAAGPLQKVIPQILDQGDEGLALFIDHLLLLSAGEREDALREVAAFEDQRALSTLGLLSGSDDQGLASAAVTSLGRIRTVAAADLLESIRHEACGEVQQATVKSLRRLAFLGIAPSGPYLPQELPPFHAASAGPVDAAGNRVIWFCRPTGEGGFVAISLQVHERHGVQSVWGESGISAEEAARQRAALECEEGAVAVSSEYAVLLLRDAIHRTREKGALLPAEFHAWRRYLGHGEVSPLPYEPRPPLFDRRRSRSASLVAESGELFDDDFFAGWVKLNRRAWDLAADYLVLEKTLSGGDLARGGERIIDTFVRDVLEPEVEPLRRRLLLLADLMKQTDRERRLIEQTLAVAGSLGMSRSHLHRHPFLRRFAFESISLAREALAEGYDPRHRTDEEVDGWE